MNYFPKIMSFLFLSFCLSSIVTTTTIAMELPRELEDVTVELLHQLDPMDSMKKTESTSLLSIGKPSVSEIWTVGSACNSK